MILWECQIDISNKCEIRNAKNLQFITYEGREVSLKGLWWNFKFYLDNKNH